jgi:hypothetical protein
MQVGYGRMDSVASPISMKASPDAEWSLVDCFSIVTGVSRVGYDEPKMYSMA